MKSFYPPNHYAMTHEEIAAVLGITRGGAWMLEQSAMRKLRRAGVNFRHLLDLVSELDSHRGREAGVVATRKRARASE